MGYNFETKNKEHGKAYELINDLVHAFLHGSLKAFLALVIGLGLTLVPTTLLYLGWNFIVANIFHFEKASYITIYSLMVFIDYVKIDMRKSIENLQTMKIFSFLITRAEKMENFIMMYFYYVTIFFAIAPLSLNIFWDNCLVNIINIPKPGYIGMVLLFLSIKLILNIFLVVKDKWLKGERLWQKVKWRNI